MRRHYRLRKPRDFAKVYDGGNSTASRLVVVYALPTQREGVRIGVAAGKKLGNAVKRNRIKRVIRAALHELLPRLKPGFDLIVIGRAAAGTARTAQAKDDLEKVLGRLKLLARVHG
ncbi:MAG TPA: ribonuclease P protein component [Bacillota bacterium]|nr:ribonuclease P protein component [Bacillota bacterium]